MTPATVVVLASEWSWSSFALPDFDLIYSPDSVQREDVGTHPRLDAENEEKEMCDNILGHHGGGFVGGRRCHLIFP